MGLTRRGRLLFLPLLWCIVMILLVFAMLTEFMPIIQMQSIHGTTFTSPTTTPKLVLSHLVNRVQEDPMDSPNIDANINNDTMEDVPFFWNDVTWNELKVRVEEINVTSSCNETLPGYFTLFYKSNQSAVHWPGPKTGLGLETVCKFDARSFTDHLPHAMQSIYACWTLWERHRGHPVLVGPPDHGGFGLRSFKDQFLDGLLKAMIQSFNVTVMTTDQVNAKDLELAVDLEIWGDAWNGRAYFMRREDAWKWTDSILRNENMERNCCNGYVRIGILNRHPGYGRTILNAKLIMEQLMFVLGEKVQVDEIIFEDKSFREQLAWLASHDIIFTSHGAQETGLPFMPKCGTLVEIFPSVYFVPEYFSSLSDSSHVQHFMMCDKQSTNPIADTKESSRSEKTLLEAKQTKLCPAIRRVLDYLLTAIREWDSCCDMASRTVTSN